MVRGLVMMASLFDGMDMDAPQDDVDLGDVAHAPGQGADDPALIAPYVSADIRDLYEIHSYRHGAAILATAFPRQWQDLEIALRDFRLTCRDIGLPGGNESQVPKVLSRHLRPKDWVETRIRADLHVRMEEYGEHCSPDGRTRKIRHAAAADRVIANYLDGHKIDYVKGRVAFDLEWNSKDQTFDRDLYAFRTFHECGLISVGVLMTRSASLNPVFDTIPALTKDGQVDIVRSGPNAGQPRTVRDKYGASTTWMGKLLYRLNAGRHGGCPMVVIGITPRLISDWPGHEHV